MSQQQFPETANQFQSLKDIYRSHYPERESALNLKDATIPRFGHNDVISYLFIETLFFHFITLLSNFQNFLSFLGITGPK